MGKNVYVASPLLPPLEEFIPYLENIWDSQRLTNAGAFHAQFEAELAKYLGVEYLSVFANGTLALITALQALSVTGEVITTAYSFVATSHALKWNGIKPVFVDVEPHSCNIDPKKIEEVITPSTTAILPVHCYGIPCNIGEIQDVADRYGLKVIYDAAHAFAVKKDNASILNAGDLSILSFHATKVFNTIEGGAVICHSEEMKQHIDHLKNFGFVDETTVVASGINGKMNEVQAAFGLLQLKHIDAAFLYRRNIYENYVNHLSSLPGIFFNPVPDGVEWNYSYCPMFIDGDVFPLTRDEVYEKLKDENIYARRYFYPLITEFPMYKEECLSSCGRLSQAMRLSRQVLCLPIHTGLSDAEQKKIIGIIGQFGSNNNIYR